MLQLDIAKIVGAKAPESVAVYLCDRGFSAKEARTLSHPHETQLLRDTTVMRLCEALLCTPNNLFRWRGPQESHLNILNTAAMSSMDTVIGQMSQQDLELFVSKVQKLTAELEQPATDGEGRLWLNVSYVITQRQQARPQSFLIDNGFTRSESRKLLDPNRKVFRVTILSRLCLTFGCLPNDLFDREGSETHYLNVLRKQTPLDLKQLLSGLAPEKVQEVLRLLKEKRN